MNIYTVRKFVLNLILRVPNHPLKWLC